MDVRYAGVSHVSFNVTILNRSKRLGGWQRRVRHGLVSRARCRRLRRRASPRARSRRAVDPHRCEADPPGGLECGLSVDQDRWRRPAWCRSRRR